MTKLSKKLISQKSGKGIIEHLHFKTQEQEVQGVIEKIVNLHKFDSTDNINPTTWNDFAILVRANSQAESFCQALEQTEIPYQFVASKGLYGKPIILDIIAYLKLLDNYHESPALYRVLNCPFLKIETKDLINLNYWARRKNWSLFETLNKATTLGGFSLETIEQINKLLGFIQKHSQLAREKTIGKVVFAFLEDTNYLKLLTQSECKNNNDSINYLNQFFKKIEEFERNNIDKSVKNFKEELELILEAGDEGALQVDLDEGPEAIKIMTIHGAKGLEFKYVFVVNLVDRRFPTIERKENIELLDALIKEIIPEGDIHLQEERRLFYVAMTRAKDGLFFTSAENYGGQRTKKLSKFLDEIKIQQIVKNENSTKQSKANEFTKKYSQKFKINSDEFTKDKIVKYNLPQKFSFTQFKAFETCPLQYKFAHILHIPTKGRFTFSFGKTMHNTLYNFFQKIINQSTTEQISLFNNNISRYAGLRYSSEQPSLSPPTTNYQLPTSLSDLLQIYEKNWIDDWYEDKKHQEEYKKKGQEILKKFYNSIKDNPPKVKYLELGFNFKLNNYLIKGVMDRVDETENKIEIIDYKTGQSKDEKKITMEDKEQLLIYQMAGQEIFKGKLLKLTFHYLNDNKKISFSGNEEELNFLKEKIIKIIEAIKKSDFLPTPNQFRCKFCDFKEICEAAKH
ncbi:MAG: ATP-dependent DNA helicase [Candidatus Kuenenbacteria bacterium]